MNDWNDDPGLEEPYTFGEPRTTIRQLVVRVVALLLLCSFLGSFFLVMRGIEDILVVIGILLGVALVAAMIRKQREQEDPYRTREAAEDEFD